MPEDKTLSGRNIGVVWKYAVAAFSAALTLAGFYFLAEQGQREDMRGQSEKLAVATAVLSSHLEDSREASRELRDTMAEQRTFNKGASETLAGLQADQRVLRDRVYEKDAELAASLVRLANEIRNRHDRRPD
jgi:septal ring factor EnvC (AmiA/AmiB activator)